MAEDTPVSTQTKEGGKAGGGIVSGSPPSWIFFGCAAMGALLASLADLSLKGGISTIAKVSSGLNSGLGLSILPIYVVVFFVCVGAIFAWLNNVTDRKTAFYAGAGVISVFMTLVPNEIPKSLSAVAPPAKSVDAARGVLPNLSWLIGTAQAEAQAKTPLPSPSSSIRLYVMDTEKHPLMDFTVTLTDPATNTIIGKSRYDNPNVAFSQPPGEYVLTVEASGYMSQSKTINITNPTTFVVPIELRATSRPDFVQKLFKRY